jgi:tellurite methyltransferase
LFVSRLEEIRKKEKEYHDDCYETQILFKDGWLQRPVETVLNLFELLEHSRDLRILDLGCGIGRNSIPIAEKLKNSNGKVIGVDLLESAIRNLEKYSQQYNVSDQIVTVISDIKDFDILAKSYDFIISVSTLEHLDDMGTFNHVLTKMIEGTIENGIHCLIINSNIKEVEVERQIPRDPMFELLFETEELVNILSTHYKDWKILSKTIKPYKVSIVRDGKRVILSSDVLTWAVQRS